MLCSLQKKFLCNYVSSSFLVKKKAEYLLKVDLLLIFFLVINTITDSFAQEYAYIFIIGDILFLLFLCFSLIKLKKGDILNAVNADIAGYFLIVFIEYIFVSLISTGKLTTSSVLETLVALLIGNIIVSLVAIEKCQSRMVYFINITLLVFQSCVIYQKYYSKSFDANAISNLILYIATIFVASIISNSLLKMNDEAISIIDNKNKKAELDLSDHKLLLRAILDTAPIYIAYVDNNETIKIANKCCASLVGKTHEEVENESVSKVVPLNTYNTYKNYFQKSLMGESIKFSKQSTIDKSKYIYGILTPFCGTSGVQEGTVVVMLDITEQKNIESEITCLNKKLLKLSSTDPLTGVYNRRKILEIAKKQITYSSEMKQSFSICMLDIDHFKIVNDTYGHSAGDKVLKEISNTCLSILRENDSFGRWGGEEFMFLINKTSIENVMSIAERIRYNISNMKILIDDKIISITVSVGVATLSPYETLDNLIVRSDNALYKAKGNGRNQVMFSK